MHISIRLRNAIVFAFLMVSMLMPAKMGMGQEPPYVMDGRLGGPGGQGALTAAVGVKCLPSGAVWISQCLPEF
jgi:hypothetical protein